MFRTNFKIINHFPIMKGNRPKEAKGMNSLCFVKNMIKCLHQKLIVLVL